MSPSQREFFVAGGTLLPDAPCYIERPADKDLLNAALTGEYCYVLTPRQMGKSSLMIRACHELKKHDVRAAIVDLTVIGSEFRTSTPEQWFYSFAHEVAHKIGLAEELKAWWPENDLITPSKRFFAFFEEFLLRRHSDSRFVVFVDEIDTTILTTFNDDFFAVLRACYNRRAEDGLFKRLCFVLLGSVSPSDLIRDARRTPFNIGRHINLDDFTFEQARPLMQGFTGDLSNKLFILRQIHDWTHGHPFLTQKLCNIAAHAQMAEKNEATIVRLVEKEFFTSAALRTEHNLRFVRNRLTFPETRPRDMLALYERVLRGELIPEDSLSEIHSRLKISGVVRVDENGYFHVRNPIYERVFDLNWIAQELRALPADEESITIQPESIQIMTETRPPQTVMNKLADQVESLDRRFFSKFYRNYTAKLRRQNRSFNVKGIVIQSLFSLELQKVFIELDLSASAKKESKGEQKVENIWKLLESEAPEYRVLAIIGKAGCGKTTMLQHVALLLAQRIGPGKRRDLIPMLLPLRKYVAEFGQATEQKSPLSEILNWEHRELNPPVGWFEEKLTKFGHKCVVLLDGLDEVAEASQRKAVAAWVLEQTRKYPLVRFVVTSRPHGYRSNPVANATLLEVEDFNEHQIENFVEKWYLNTEIAAAGQDHEDVRRRAEDLARHLLHIIFQTEALARLALNPLLLTMITMVHRYVGHLPEARAALYEDIIKVLLGRREHTVIAGVKLSYYQKRGILQVLALALMLENRREIAADEAAALIAPALQRVGLPAEESPTFLKAMMDESGLLLEYNIGTLAFAHLTYQEFLTASEIKERNRADLLIAKLGDSWWHETTLLYAAIADVSELVRACLVRARRAGTHEIADLRLAYEISQEAMQVDPPVRRELEALVILEAESNDVERQRLAANLIFEIRLARMIRLRPGVHVDQYFISRLEYQAFINATGRQPDHWLGWGFSGREGLQPISGVRRSDALAYIAWLNERAADLGHPRSRFRLPTRDELKLVQINREPQDFNFKALANPGFGTWVNDETTLASEADEKEIVARAILTKAAGEQELRRMAGYYPFANARLQKICDELEALQREARQKADRLGPDRLWQHASLVARDFDVMLDKLTALKESYRELEAHARQIEFKLEPLPDLDQLDVEINELSRLRFRRSGSDSYEEKDVPRITGLLVRAEIRFEDAKKAPALSLGTARREHDLLVKILREELDAMATEPIDLEQHLDFLMQKPEPNPLLEEVRTILQRAIGRDHTKAKAELLRLAEQALFADKQKMLKKILRGFWAIFIVEHRRLKKDPLLTWESLRLVREIKQREEEGELQ